MTICALRRRRSISRQASVQFPKLVGSNAVFSRHVSERNRVRAISTRSHRTIFAEWIRDWTSGPSRKVRCCPDNSRRVVTFGQTRETFRAGSGHAASIDRKTCASNQLRHPGYGVQKHLCLATGYWQKISERVLSKSFA